MSAEPEGNGLWCPMINIPCLTGGCAAWRLERGASSGVPFSPTVDAVLSELMGSGDNSRGWSWSRQKAKSGERILSTAVSDWQRNYKPGWFEFVSSRGQDEAEKIITSRLKDKGLDCEVRIGRGSQYPFSISIQEVLLETSQRGYCGLAGRPS